MFRKCRLCRTHQYPGTCLLLAVNLDKFENLMEAIGYDNNKLENSVICRSCNDLICEFYNFKSTLMKREKKCTSHIDTERKDNLQKLLMNKNTGINQDNLDMEAICRICLKAGKKENYKEINSFQCELGQIASSYLPELDLFLCNQVLICSECNETLLKFFNFVTCCLQSLNVAYMTVESDDDDDNHLDKRRKLPEINELITDVTDSFVSEQEILVPVAPLKRKRDEDRENKLFFSCKPTKLQALTQPQKVNCRKKSTTKNKGKETCTATDFYEQNFSYVCQICPAIYDSFQAILEHVEFHKKDARFNCFKCDFSTGFLFGLRNHLFSHDLDLFEIVPENADTEDNDGIRLPIKSPSIDIANSEKYIECQLCLERLQSLLFFEKHMIDHLEAKDIHCLKCPYVCNIIADMQRHMKSTHNISSLHRVYPIVQENVHIGSTVKEEFSVNENEKQSIESISKRINCAFCSRQFNSPVDYAIHDCPKIDEYCCGHCSGVFYSLDELDDHICLSVLAENNMAHANQNKKKIDRKDHPTETMRDKETPLDPHNCDDKILSSPTNNQHLVCAKCSVGFDSPTQLSRHACPQIEPANISSFKNEAHPVSKFKVQSGFVCESDTKFSVHNSRDITVEVPFVCSYCHSLLDTIGKLEMHHCHISSFANIIEARLKEKFDCNGKYGNSKLIMNKIANVIDKKIAKGPDEEVAQDEFDCVGCGFKISKKYEFFLHLNECEKVKKCQCCPYVAKIVRNLQTHCCIDHNKMIFACSYCKFATFMEKSDEAPTLVYSDDLSYIWEEKRACTETVTAVDKLQEKIDVDSKSLANEFGDLYADKESPPSNTAICLIEAVSTEENFEANVESCLNEGAAIVLDKSGGSTENYSGHLELALKSNEPGPSQDEEVIHIDSDSDNEFIECAENRTINPPTIVEEVRTLDPFEASQLISQGVPILMESNFSNMQIQPLMAIPLIHSYNPDSNQLSDNNSTESIFVTDDDDSTNSTAGSQEVIPLQPDDGSKGIESVVISDDDDTSEGSRQFNSLQNFCLINDVGTINVVDGELGANIYETDNCENYVIICEDELESVEQGIENNQNIQFINGNLLRNDSTNEELENNCVVIEDDDDFHDTKALTTKTNNTKIKRPPNSFQLFAKKLKEEIKQAHPGITWLQQKTLIVSNWKNLSSKDKLPFIEESRLLRKLFIQEHPDQWPLRRTTKKHQPNKKTMD